MISVYTLAFLSEARIGYHYQRNFPNCFPCSVRKKFSKILALKKIQNKQIIKNKYRSVVSTASTHALGFSSGAKKAYLGRMPLLHFPSSAQENGFERSEKCLLVFWKFFRAVRRENFQKSSATFTKMMIRFF